MAGDEVVLHPPAVDVALHPESQQVEQETHPPGHVGGVAIESFDEGVGDGSQQEESLTHGPLEVVVSREALPYLSDLGEETALFVLAAHVLGIQLSDLGPYLLHVVHVLLDQVFQVAVVRLDHSLTLPLLFRLLGEYAVLILPFQTVE